MRTEATKENIGLLSHKDKVRFALFCTKQAKQTVPEAIACVRVVERWLDGKATTDECERVANAAYAASVTYANANAARAAAHAANAASNVASNATAYAAYTAAYIAYVATAAADAAIKQAQEAYLYELIHINTIVEQVLLNA